MTSLSHYNVFSQKVGSEPTKAEVWNNLCPNLFVVAEVLVVSRTRVEVKVEKVLGTTKSHLHKLVANKIYGEIDPDELDYDIRKGDTIYGTTPMIHLIIVGLIKSVDAQKELLTIDCSTSLPLAFGDIKLGLQLGSHTSLSNADIPSNYNYILQTDPKFINPYATQLMAHSFGFSESEEISSAKCASTFLARKNYYATDFYDVIQKEQTRSWAQQVVKEGIAHAKLGKHGLAMECYKRALKTDPTNADAYVARGASYFKSSLFIEAKQDFESALVCDPQHINAYKYLQSTKDKIQELETKKKQQQQTLDALRITNKQPTKQQQQAGQHTKDKNYYDEYERDDNNSIRGFFPSEVRTNKPNINSSANTDITERLKVLMDQQKTAREREREKEKLEWGKNSDRYREKYKSKKDKSDKKKSKKHKKDKKRKREDRDRDDKRKDKKHKY